MTSNTKTITTLTSREFNQAASEAKRAAMHGPVFITDRGTPAHVLMSIDHYRSLIKSRGNIADLLAMPADATGIDDDFDLDLERARKGEMGQAADFS